MRKGFIVLALATTTAYAQEALQFGPVHESNVQLIDDLALVVNHQGMSRSQLNRALSAETKAVGDAALEPIIMQLVVEQLADRADIEVSNAELDRAIASIAAQNKISVEALLNHVAKNLHLSQAAYRDMLRKQIRLSRVKQRVAGQDLRLNPAQVNDQLAAVMREQGSTIHLQDMLIPLKGGDVYARGQDVSKIMESVSQALKASNNDLQTAAQAISGAQFVDLGDVNIARIPQRFATAVVNLKGGEMVQTPVIDADGLHFLKVISQTPQGAAQVLPELKVEHILISKAANPSKAKYTIDQLYTRLMGGANFADMARTYSEDAVSAVKGGDLGWVSPEDLDGNFAKVMLSTPLHTYSQPFESAYGWHILRVNDRREVNRSEEVLRRNIRDTLYQNALEMNWQEKLIQARQNAYIAHP